jgi:hypothetical protein
MRSASHVNIIAVACLLATSMAGHGQNLLLNGGFENGTGSAADSWSMFGNSFRDTRSAQTGSYGISMYGNFVAGVNYSGLYQDVPAVAGAAYLATVYVSTADYDQIGPDNTAFLKLEFYDASTNYLGAFPASNPLTNTSPVDTWILQTVSVTAPAGAATVRTTLIFEQDNGAGGSAFFDNVSLLVNPQPQITSITAGKTNSLISFSSILGATHEVDIRDDMSAGSWSVLTNNITGTGDIMQIGDQFSSGQQKRFYRVKASY